MIFGAFTSKVPLLCNGSKFMSKNVFKCCYNNLRSRGLCSAVVESAKNKPPTVVHAIPALRDNYMYVVINYAEKLAFAIDPVEPEKVVNFVEREKVVLSQVLTTHHHFDHSGGNEEIAKLVRGIPIYGADSRVPAMTYRVKHGDTFNIGSFTVECLLTPCHTKGHVCFFIKQKNGESICFTGDTLFVAGCGRFFEGNAEHMLKALNILSNLPHHTKIYCGHEYAVTNLQFAVEVEPSNLAASEKLTWALSRRNACKATVPSTIGEELKYNPFLRVREAEVQDYTKQTDPVKVMDALRTAKDNFIPV